MASNHKTKRLPKGKRILFLYRCNTRYASFPFGLD